MDYMLKKLDVGVTEESIPTEIHEKIPALGRLFKASNVAFKAWQYRTRADLFDKLYEKAQKNGSDVKRSWHNGKRINRKRPLARRA